MQTVDVNAEAARVLAAGPDPHDILGCPRGAPLADVKARYKKLCALHPDKAHSNALAAEAFALISAAYRKLKEAGAAGPGALHGIQPEAAPAFNRWQAFTGGRQHPQPAAPTQPQPQPQPQPQQPFPGSQENTPGGGNAGVGSGPWQASAKWGRFGSGGTSLLRAQPVAAVPAGAAGHAGAEQPAVRQQQPVWAEQQARRRSLSLGSSGGFSGGSNSDGSSGSGTDSDDDFQRAGGRRLGAGVKPAAFYGPTGVSSSKQWSETSPSLSQPTPSLYGMFAGRRSSGGQASGWLGAGTVAGTAPPEQDSLSQPPAVVQQPAAAGVVGSKWGSDGVAGGHWGGGGRLADMLKKAPVVAPAVRTAPGLAAAAVATTQPQQLPQQEEQEAQPAGAAPQQSKRRQPPTPLSSSASDSDDVSWDESGEDWTLLHDSSRLRTLMTHGGLPCGIWQLGLC